MDSIAVVILTKNNFDILKNCLDSFKEKNSFTNVKFYIGDTGSTNKELVRLNNYCKNLPYKKEIIKFNYYNFSKNYNWIIKNRVTEDFVLFCNDDIELKTDALSIMYKKYSTDIGTLGCKLLFPDNTIQHAGQIHCFNEAQNVYFATHDLYKERDRILPDKYCSGNTFAFCLIKREIFLNLDCLNEKYKQCYEDVDFNIKCTLKNLKHKFVGDAVCYHHESVTRKKNFVDEIDIEDQILINTKLKKLYTK